VLIQTAAALPEVSIGGSFRTPSRIGPVASRPRNARPPTMSANLGDPPMILQSVRRLLFESPTVKDVRRNRLTMISPERLRRLSQAADEALKVEGGDVLEFGVALGGSAALLARTAKKHGCRFAGFDVFDLHPPPSDNDDDAAEARYQVIVSGKAEGIGGDVYYGYQDALLQRVTRSLEGYGLPVDGKTICLIKGYFEETWPEFPRRPVAFAHIDVSWHDPVQYALDAVAPLLTKSGCIVVNTYDDAAGARKAVDNFLISHPTFKMEAGVSPILRRG
jgi:O-methyltransferase